ncbi:hypothetical protein A6770_21985 [Nostoc minutum NIES-26]|uniref:Uncharacterized protein n=1 Tax=Nostoc minutum NIES-26 TaxID=1844469 RepID=A0A367QZ27_9NOSO|nr:hypothetical protein A6770_21985 [Nostoc minutum NIES-26]
MVQEKVERESTLSKPVQDKSDTPKAVHSLLPEPSQQLTLEEHRQRHEKVTSNWRNNNVLKSIKARSLSSSIQTQSQVQTEQSPDSQQSKATQEETKVTEGQRQIKEEEEIPLQKQIGQPTRPAKGKTDPKAIIELNKFIELVKNVEKAYSSDNASQIVIRIHNLYYSGARLGFRALLPNADKELEERYKQAGATIKNGLIHHIC